MPQPFTKDEWKELESYEKLLEPFKTATVILNADSYPNLSQYFPIVKLLQNMCGEYADCDYLTDYELVKNLHNALEERFNYVTVDIEHLI